MTAILSVWFRYAVLFAARWAGRAYRFLSGPWTLVAATLAVGVPWVLGLFGKEVGSHLLRALSLVVILVVLRWVLRARKRLIVANFVDYTGTDPRTAPGMSSLLQVELARLYDLMRVVDESRAVPEAVRGPQNVFFDEERTLPEAQRDPDQTTSEPLDVPAPIRAEDVTNVLDAVVSIEATMAVGPVKVPIGALASLVGRLAQGPRLVGSVHGTADTLVVSARTVGDKVGHVWRVDPPPRPSGDPAVRPEDLLDELAVRVFTDLAPGGSVKWKATWHYVNGLRAYRECLRTRKDRRLNLEKAKDLFVQAIADDDRFHLAHYNLGVVATELQQWDAAEAAFLAAIDRNPERWDPYYGLAQLYFALGRYDEMLPLCSRMVELGDRRAESYHLRALANLCTGNVAGAVDDRRAAVWSAWSRLCKAALKGRESRAARVAASSLRNLAGIRAYRANRPSSPDDHSHDGEDKRPLRLTLAYLAAGWQLRQGISLHPSDAELHFELGKVYAARRKWRAAIRHFERAVQIVPDRPRFWVQLARAYAGPLCQTHGGEQARDDCAHLRRQALAASKRAYEQPSELADSGFDRLAALYRTLARCGVDPEDRDEQLERLAKVRQIRRFETQRRRWETEPPADRALAEQLDALDCEALWESTQLCLEIARRYRRETNGQLEAGRDVAGKVAERLLELMDELGRLHPREVHRRDVHAVVAQLLHGAGRQAEALREAEAAVVHNPLSYQARATLAEVQLALGHLAQAEAAWRGALVCEPDRPYANFRLAETLVRRALECHFPERKRSMLEAAKEQFKTTLALCDLRGHPAGPDGESPATAVSTGQVAYWLGRAHFDLDEYEEAATQLELAVHLDHQRPLARLRLGVAYVRMGHFCEGEHEFEEVLGGAGSPREDADQRVVGPPGDELSWREVRTWARIYLAAAHIERDAGVKEAVATIEQVGADLEKLDPRVVAGFRAVCADWEGWGWFVLGDDDRAIERVTSSVEHEPTADAYLHLAQLYARRALDGPEGGQRRSDEERARRAAELARRMGLGVVQQRPLDAVLGRLDVESVAQPVG
ncbi:MAG TPA: tetratricopeptide repeat protein [Acidimicrobiales bacterium]|nr:tetratricopeptide repeat protein [Acidimicrobiales bacterium]